MDCHRHRSCSHEYPRRMCWPMQHDDDGRDNYSSSNNSSLHRYDHRYDHCCDLYSRHNSSNNSGHHMDKYWCTSKSDWLSHNGHCTLRMMMFDCLRSQTTYSSMYHNTDRCYSIAPVESDVGVGSILWNVVGSVCGLEYQRTVDSTFDHTIHLVVSFPFPYPRYLMLELECCMVLRL